jgi:hypothetical protein
MRPSAESEPAKAALRGGVFPQRGSSLAIYQELKARVQRPDALRQAKCVCAAAAGVSTHASGVGGALTVCAVQRPPRAPQPVTGAHLPGRPGLQPDASWA